MEWLVEERQRCERQEISAIKIVGQLLPRLIINETVGDEVIVATGCKMESSLYAILFMIFYLVTIWLVLLQVIGHNLRTGWLHKRDGAWRWTLTAYVLLGVGDIFHLGSRIYLFFSPLQLTTSFAHLLVGVGSLLTGITMTYFYVALFHAWEDMYSEAYAPEYNVRMFSYLTYGAFISRLVLMALPYNRWIEGDATVDFGFNFRIITSLPLYVVGAITVYLFLTTSMAEKDHPKGTLDVKRNQGNHNAAIAYLFSYFMYSITLFFVGTYPITGLFMIPKTIAYLVALYYHYTTMLNRSLQTA